MTEQKILFYEVPAGTPSRPCTGGTCKATVFFIDRPSGKQMPVHCDVDGGYRPSSGEGDEGSTQHNGLGVNHYTDCPDTGQFHRRKK